ncbi:MAG: hypothetical protein FWD68_20280 [Alphaproteobacteria bacterium]|nr:hypothetical protein [Alphaproteobacteria bacterium]
MPMPGANLFAVRSAVPLLPGSLQRIPWACIHSYSFLGLHFVNTVFTLSEADFGLISRTIWRAHMVYRRSPITEASIQFTFARQFDREAVESAVRSLMSRYATQDRENRGGGAENAQNSGTNTGSEWELRLISADRSEQQIFRSNSTICSALAPYPGWHILSERARYGWEAWKSVARSTDLSR